MKQAKSRKEQEILENVVKAELDYITYVDVETGETEVIVTNEEAGVPSAFAGDYETVNEKTVLDFVHPEDREYCEKLLELINAEANK